MTKVFTAAAGLALLASLALTTGADAQGSGRGAGGVYNASCDGGRGCYQKKDAAPKPKPTSGQAKKKGNN